MDKDWIVLANASRARICRLDPPDGQLTELAAFEHPESRQKGAAAGDDRTGHGEHGGGASGHGRRALAPHGDPDHKAAAAFARELAAHLDAAVASQRCRSWWLLAGNPFLGELKARLGAGTTAALRAAEPLDLTALPAAELRQRLQVFVRQRR